MKLTIQFTTASKRVKNIGINQEIKDLKMKTIKYCYKELEKT